MKFVVFSPFAKASAIGRVTSLIVRAMSDRGDTVVIVRTEKEQLLATPMHTTHAVVIPWTDDEAVRAAADGADALVYQIGNSFTYHCGGLHWLAQLPGIVCLHDFLVAHLFAEWAYEHQEEARRVLAGWYGPDAVADFFKPDSPQAFIDMASRLYPMTEWLSSMALGVVSHSHWGMLRVGQACAGPLRVMPLPYDAPSSTQDGAGAILAPDDRRRDGTISVLTVGHVNSNKRIDSVIRAIGSSAYLRRTVTYRLCGLIEPRMTIELTTLARSQGVNLEISGETDDHELQRAMNDADIVCCLRWPSLEAASATTIEGLLYGKAVVVTDAAFYSELPDDCVQKISLTDEVAELRAALEHLSRNGEAREAMALRGQAWANRTFDARSYADQLAAMAAPIAAAAPLTAMVQSLYAQLRQWECSAALVAPHDLAGVLTIFHSPEQRNTVAGLLVQAEGEAAQAPILR